MHQIMLLHPTEHSFPTRRSSDLISVVNVKKKNDSEEKQDEYISLLVKNIKDYIKSNHKVYLYSFCEYEGDEVTIDAILEEFKGNESVIPVKYNGDLDKFFEIYSKMEYMICGRFHAMILSCVCKQKMFVTSYSDKIDNVVEDLKLNIPIVRLEKIKKETSVPLDEFIYPGDEKVTKIIEEAKKQDEIFEKILTNS